jgi:tRNA (guanine-N7-)-methyltransferase
MAYRVFRKPEPTPTTDAGRPPPRDDPRTSLVGGSIEMRRLHGTPSEIEGRFVLDPIFVEQDFAELRSWCDPADPRPLVIEIGFQLGRFARAFCTENPTVRYLGFEVRKKFCQEASEYLDQGGVENARLALVDAREMLPLVVTSASVHRIFAMFPDPWWKKKHMKKRLVSRQFTSNCADWLEDDGQLLIKTDVQGYADWAQEEMTAQGDFEVKRLSDTTAGLPETQRERRCRLRGLPTWAIEARRLPRTGNGA